MPPSKNALTRTRIKRFARALLVIFITQTSLSALAQPQTGKAILKKAIEATGGRFNGVRGPLLWMTQGVSYRNGHERPFVSQFASKYPNWFRREIKGQFTLTVSNDRAWLTRDGNAEQLNSNDHRETLRQVRLIWATRLFPLQDGSQYKLATIPGVRIDSKETVGLRVTHTDGQEFDLYFDADDFRLRKLAAKTKRVGSESIETVEVFFSDHRSFAGVRMPAKSRVFYDGELTTESELVAYKAGATLDPDFFEYPF